MKCRRPLWVYVVKDGLGAAILASIIVTLCRGTMPSNKTVWSYFPAGFTAFLTPIHYMARVYDLPLFDLCRARMVGSTRLRLQLRMARRLFYSA
jgi:hypothetical protein